MANKCSECGTMMVHNEKSEYSFAYVCPKCGRGAWVMSMTKKELREEARLAYMDGRHWNRGGGLNK